MDIKPLADCTADRYIHTPTVSANSSVAERDSVSFSHSQGSYHNKLGLYLNLKITQRQKSKNGNSHSNTAPPDDHDTRTHRQSAGTMLTADTRSHHISSSTIISRSFIQSKSSIPHRPQHRRILIVQIHGTLNNQQPT